MGDNYMCEEMAYHPDTSFANQLRRYIQSTAKVGWENNRLTGKRINKRALKRIVTGTREYNRRVFQRKHDKQALNTCITLLVDWSGSMYGTRAEIAANAAAILTDCFENVLGVPVEVLGHTERRGGLWMYNIKKYGERLSGQDVFNRFKKCEMSGNADADALLYTYDRIRNRPEKRKIVLSISDGCPADCYDYNTDPGTMLVHTVNMIRGEGVEVHGIGAEHPQVKEFYGSDSEVVMDLASLAPTLLNAAKKFVLSS
jgi:cobalamin biosynthesis protein CobT